MGKSAQQMLQALIDGELTPETMADFARGRMRSKRELLVQALTGHLQAHHRFLLAEHLKHLSQLQDCYLSAHYHRLAFRRGKKRAAVALAHTLLIIVYHMLTHEEDYQELGGTYFDTLDRDKKEKSLVRQLQRLGFEVALTPTPPQG